MVGQNNFIVTNENARSPIIVAGYFGPDTRHDLKATYAADVFSTIVTLKTAELQKELVDKGLAFTANVSYQTCKYTGPITIFLVPNPAKINEAIKVLREQMAKWDSDTYFTDEQLETAKNQLAIQEAYNREKTSNYVHTVTFWWASASIDYYTSYIDNINKVTREDIKSYVKKYINDQPSAWGMLISPDMKKKLNIDETIFDKK
jgi:zinc protease